MQSGGICQLAGINVDDHEAFSRVIQNPLVFKAF
jgi:hypothetical protein